MHTDRMVKKNIPQHFRIFLIWFALGLAALLLAACAGAGPSSRDLLNAPHAANAEYVLVDIDERTVGVLSTWHRPSLSAVFGDYRKPVALRVGVGDTVQVNVWEAGSGSIFATPGFERVSAGSRPSQIPDQVVADDGTIAMPYVGRVRVKNKTPAEIEAEIVRRLQGKTAQPQVIVSVTRNVSSAVTVTGDVVSGARVPVGGNGERVLDVITAAGGIKAPVSETSVVLVRDGQSLAVPMQALLANSAENIYVRPGDLVTVIRAPQSFTAVGATGRQAVVGFDGGGLTLEEALGKAGGLLDERADPRGVFVLRFESSALVAQFRDAATGAPRAGIVPVVYRIDLSNPAALFHARRFAMRDKDILYVSNAPISDVEKIFRLFGTLTSPALSTYTTYRASL